MKKVKEKIEAMFDDFSCAVKLNADNLDKIIRDNLHTAFGNKHQFHAIRDIPSYQRLVPLSEYKDYSRRNPSVYPTIYTVHTSGSTGKPKLLALSSETLARYDSLIYDMPYYLCGTERGKSLHMSVFPNPEKISVLSTVYFNYLEENKLFTIEDFVEGRRFLFNSVQMDILYVKLRIALTKESLFSIQSVFLYEIVLLIQYLLRNWRRIVRDIELRECSISLPSLEREQLKSFTCSEKRVEQLKSELQKNSSRNLIPRLWKKMAFVSGIGGEALGAYDTLLKHYLGDIPISYFAYAQSECISGIATKLNKAEYTLLPRSAFYEFLDSENRIILSGDLKIGMVYQPIITTFSGLYRYKTGDRLLLTGFEGESPVFRVLGRTNLTLNIAGEKLNETVLTRAVQWLIKEYRLTALTFMTGVDKTCFPSRYAVFTDIPSSFFPVLTIALDRKLKDLSRDYKELRDKNFIASPVFYPVAFNPLMKRDTHVKPKILLADAETATLLMGVQQKEKRWSICRKRESPD